MAAAHRPAMADFPFDMVGFDLDGTLVDTKLDLAAATNHALALAGRPPVAPGRMEALIGGGTRRLLQRALEESGGALPDGEFDALYADLLAHYEANIAVHSQPYPGCLDALDALAARGCALSVVTNKPEYLSVKLLDALAMRSRFASVIGGDTAARPKPGPEPIAAALAAGGGTGRFAMVGDSAFDVGAARAAQVPCVLVSFGFSETPARELGADAVVDHFDELVAILQGLTLRRR
jgi:phosphoglycolate phosphatase